MNSHKIIGTIIIILGLLSVIGGGAIIFWNFQLTHSLYGESIMRLERDIPEEILKKPAEITTDNFPSYGVAQILDNQIKITKFQNMQLGVLSITDTILGGLFIILGLTIVCFGLIVRRILNVSGTT